MNPRDGIAAGVGVFARVGLRHGEAWPSGAVARLFGPLYKV